MVFLRILSVFLPVEIDNQGQLLYFATTLLSAHYAIFGLVMARKKEPVTEYLSLVGDNIRRWRNKRGYTLEEVGMDIGMDKSNLHHIEQGKNITLVTLLKLSAVLEVKPTDLLETNTTITAEDAELYARRKKSRKGN
jgi:DNA-binding Xre family transcriptional regulator